MENGKIVSKASSETRDFADLRATNDPPKFDVQATICNIISALDKDILRLDRSIATFENELKKYKAKRARRVKRRSDYASLISPLRSLPLEILGEIFLFAASESLSFRLTASHVCQRWRTAALSTSELWSTIHGLFSASPQALQEYIQACVHRARSRPLKLLHASPLHLSQIAVLRIIMQATQGCPWQVFAWGDMDIALLQTVQGALASNSHDTMESLQVTLETSAGSSDAYSASSPILDASIFSKRLRSLTFSWNRTINPTTLNAPWSHLTRLDIACTKSDNQTILGILRQCSNVEEFKIASTYIDSATPDAIDTPIYLPKLRKLHLATEPSFFSDVADVVVTPLLRELVLNAGGFLIELGEESQLCQYLMAGAKSLRRLWITGVSNRDIEQTILRLELLEELTLVCTDDISAEALCCLLVEARSPCTPKASSETGTVPSKAHIPLRYLYALNIVCTPEFEIQDVFERIVDSRWWPDDKSTQMRPVVRLRHVSLRTSCQQDRMITTDKVEYWKQQGLDANVLTPSEVDFTPGFISSH